MIFKLILQRLKVTSFTIKLSSLLIYIYNTTYEVNK